MENKLRIKRLIIPLSLILLSLVLMVQPVFASDNLKVNIADKEPMAIPVGEILFNEPNLVPGDTIEKKLTINNNYQDSSQLSLRALRVSEEPEAEGPDLYKQLLMTIQFRGKELFSGPMIDFATERGVPLGTFEPGEEQDLDVLVHLPGEATGNEFMASALETRWIITALLSETITTDPDPKKPSVEVKGEVYKPSATKKGLPKTGELVNLLFPIIGLATFSTGLVLLKKKKDQ